MRTFETLKLVYYADIGILALFPIGAHLYGDVPINAHLYPLFCIKQSFSN